MNSRKQLKLELIVETGSSLVFAIICILGIVFIAVDKEAIQIVENKIISNIFFYGLILFLSLSVVLLVVDFFKDARDFKAIKTGQFETITGTILKFAKNQDADSGIQINCKPIIKILNSNEEIMLKINSFLEVGETYDFIYLKHSKIGAVNDKS